ncbi:hypothetical protein EPN83_02965 [Patescibacteria group bacterium]|nr:MAG: hypothetical protein EPN83_02965 [Patescibacteria group bacterium]
MNCDLFFDGKRFISSSRAAKISGYANDYIGQLCRGGKLDCRMVGRTWYVSLESLTLHKNLFVGQPARIHHGGKARRPITKVVLEEKIADKQLDQEQAGPEVIQAYEKKLPKIVYKREEGPFLPILTPRPRPTLRVVGARSLGWWVLKGTKIATAVIVVALALSVFSALVTVSPRSQQFFAEVFERATPQFFDTGFSLSRTQLSSAQDVLDEFAFSFYRSLRDTLREARQRVLVKLSGKKDLAQGDLAPAQGMVVVPSHPEEKRDTTIARIKNAFSDEVQVRPDVDGESGVITPVFKTVTKDEYLYVLVPIRN